MLPEPMAKPSTIANNRLWQVLDQLHEVGLAGAGVLRLVLSSPWSLPEQKALGPEPEITTTLISESLPASSRPPTSRRSSGLGWRCTPPAVDGYPGNPIFLLIQDVCVSQGPSSCFNLTDNGYGIPNGAQCHGGGLSQCNGPRSIIGEWIESPCESPICQSRHR